jgi:hypothetical protein
VLETPAQHWRELSAYDVATMVRISLSWWYTMSTPSVEGACNVSRSMTMMTTFWLALAKVGLVSPRGCWQGVGGDAPGPKPGQW